MSKSWAAELWVRSVTKETNMEVHGNEVDFLWSQIKASKIAKNVHILLVFIKRGFRTCYFALCVLKREKIQKDVL